jgi:hypothetical protein
VVEWTCLERVMAYVYLVFFYWCAYLEPYKNSLDRKYRIELVSPFINSISKSKFKSIDCYMVKNCYEIIFWTSFQWHILLINNQFLKELF